MWQWLLPLYFGLRRGSGIKGHQHGGVDCAGIVEEDANNLLEACECHLGGCWRCVVVKGVLDHCAVCWGDPVVGSMLGKCRVRMLKILEGAGNVSHHGDIDGVVKVVPG